jgi:hypothetical protein
LKADAVGGSANSADYLSGKVCVGVKVPLVPLSPNRQRHRSRLQPLQYRRSGSQTAHRCSGRWLNAKLGLLSYIVCKETPVFCNTAGDCDVETSGVVGDDGIEHYDASVGSAGEVLRRYR